MLHRPAFLDHLKAATKRSPIGVAGERVKAFVFVATLGYCRRTFARIYPSLQQRHWLEGVEAALRHFRGVPEECMVDNAKALVLRWKGGPSRVPSGVRSLLPTLGNAASGLLHRQTDTFQAQINWLSNPWRRTLSIIGIEVGRTSLVRTEQSPHTVSSLGDALAKRKIPECASQSL